MQFSWIRPWFSAAAETIAPSICMECGGFAQRGWACDACFSSCRLWDESWCQLCGLPLDHGHADFCRFGKLPARRPGQRTRPWNAFFALGAYTGVLRKACLAAKTPDHAWLAEPLAREWWNRHGHSARELGHCLLVPIPRHWSRRLGTGHDPAIRFAAALSRVWAGMVPGARIRTGLILKRTRATPRLATLDRDQRFETVHNLFALKVPSRLRLEQFDRIVLVDDIATTGATAISASNALKATGLNSLHLAVIARTLEPSG